MSSVPRLELSDNESDGPFTGMFRELYDPHFESTDPITYMMGCGNIWDNDRPCPNFYFEAEGGTTQRGLVVPAARAAGWWVGGFDAYCPRCATIDPLEALRDHQDGHCAICERTGRPLVVDHDHETGLVRGLLCARCNADEGVHDFPWLRAYRAHPPAAALGLEIQYGQHRTRPHPRTLPGWREPVLEAARRGEGPWAFLFDDPPHA